MNRTLSVSYLYGSYRAEWNSESFGTVKRSDDRSDHGTIGTSLDATAAHADMLRAALKAGVPINVTEPYTHVIPEP